MLNLTKRVKVGALSFVLLPWALAHGNDAPTAAVGETMKIRLTVNGRVLTARMIDSPTAKDLIALLPLTLRMNDLFKREKYGHLPHPLSADSKHTHRYALGDISYWSPGPDVAIYYDHDGERIPDPGVIVIGKITAGLEAFKVPGPGEVTMESVK